MLLLFSDTCGGQNRNKYVAGAMLYAVKHIANLEIIDLKFMESGHSYLEADSMHSTIERARKHKQIYTTREWAILIAMARRNPRPYKVEVLSHSDFYDLQELIDFIMLNVKVNEHGQTVQWLNIKWLRFVKQQPYKIFYKYELKDEETNTEGNAKYEFMSIDILKNRRTRRTRDWNTVILNKKYKSRLPIAEAKFKDLCTLLSSGVIPQEYKSYIEDLPHGKVNIPEDFD